MTLAHTWILPFPSYMSPPLVHIQKDNKSNEWSSCRAYEVLTSAVLVYSFLEAFVFLGEGLPRSSLLLSLQLAKAKRVFSFDIAPLSNLKKLFVLIIKSNEILNLALLQAGNVHLWRPLCRVSPSFSIRRFHLGHHCTMTIVNVWTSGPSVYSFIHAFNKYLLRVHLASALCTRH